MEYKQIKCTCERPDDNACDYCDEQESKRILKEAKERYSEQETLEKAAKKYYEDNQFKSNYPHSPYSFIDGAKWQAERMYSEEEVLTILYFRSIYQDHFESNDEIKEWFDKLKKQSNDTNPK
jgi:hypothetical protein